jgi:hypothetical protein
MKDLPWIIIMHLEQVCLVYCGIPRAPDGTRMFEFDLSIPWDEFGLRHYDVY